MEYAATAVMEWQQKTPANRAEEFRSAYASSEELHLTAVHEAGHAVGALETGGLPFLATIEPYAMPNGLSIAGRVWHYRMSPQPSVLTAIAGPAAEARQTGYLLCDGFDEANITAALKRLGRRREHYEAEAAKLVRLNWEAILRVAAALMDQGTIWSAGELFRIIRGR